MTEPLQNIAVSLLLKHPGEAIPALINLLSDYERGEVAENVLLQFNPEILSSTTPEFEALISAMRVRRSLLSMKNHHGLGRCLRVFLFYFNVDKSAIRDLYRFLLNE